jgi:hypothetical protein
MRVRINHPTDRPNFAIVYVGEITLAFSYETVIAFCTWTTGWVVSINYWGPTTGKHLNYLDNGNHKDRLPDAEFKSRLESVLGSIGSVEL